VVDLEGRAVDPLPARGAGPTVLVFTRTDCPLSNRYAPTLRRLHDRFSAAGARFWLVYPDGTEDGEEIRRHGRDFGFGFPALRDPDHALVALTGATVTPEVAVFVPAEGGPRMVYRGRIDDRAVDLRRTRPQATTHDLEQVLDALAAGGTLDPRTTPAVGCFIPK
jgi:AhpC/TSA family protein